MSKPVKRMQMDALKQTFQSVRDMVLLSMSGIPAAEETRLRLALRRKNVRLHMVKNTLAAKVFQELGLGGLEPYLRGPTTVAWGSDSIAELSKTLDEWLQKTDKIKAKVAVAEGTIVPFEQAKRFPTRQEAIARVVQLVLAPAMRVAGQLRSPGARLASQIKSLAEREPVPAGP
ncbi:MAG: 50S ribosomal protein L10 [Gemmataceae bacterium]